MRLCFLFRVCMPFMVYCCALRYAACYVCKTPPFDKRRCYELCILYYKASWKDATVVCRDKGQRLASMETGRLVDFVKANIDFSDIWIGLSRTSDGQADMWTSGHRLDASLYPGVTLNVSRGSEDNGKLCSKVSKNSQYIALVNTACNVPMDILCETFRSNIFQVKSVDDVVNNVSSGQPVVSDTVISVIDCVRKCSRDWSCHAISHDGVTCRLHFLQTGHSVTVTSSAVTYARTASSTN